MKTKILVLAITGLLAATPTYISAAQLSTSPSGGPIADKQTDIIYLMNNQVPNSISVFNLFVNGSLWLAGTYPTGGNGDPVAQPGDPPTDPLASQGSLILTQDNRFLLAVNAGSNELSLFRIKGDTLVPIEKVASGGTRPISVTQHGSLVYVLNEGNSPNISGFRFESRETLAPLMGSTRPLDGGGNVDPAEVSFSPDGSLLVVTQKASGTITTYTVGADGLPNGPITNKSNGITPFGFAFTKDNTAIVAEAFDGESGRAAVSSYNLLGSALGLVSASVPNKQTATCWVAITADGRYAFTSNTGSNTISSYQIQTDGTVDVLQPGAIDNGPGSAPIDLALTGQHLFVHLAGNRALSAFRILSGGQLQGITVIGGLPFGAQGIAAKQR
jgi:6-phosphogluconolactonase